MSILKKQLYAWASSPRLSEKILYIFIDRLTQGLLYLVVLVFLLLPDFFARLVLLALVYLLRVFARKEIHQLRINISQIWNLPAGSFFAKLFEKQILTHQVRVLYEQICVFKSGKKIEVEGVDLLARHLDFASREEKGILVVTGHLGSWEILSSVCSQHWNSGPVHVLGKPGPLRSVKSFMLSIYEAPGARLLFGQIKLASSKRCYRFSVKSSF